MFNFSRLSLGLIRKNVQQKNNIKEIHTTNTFSQNTKNLKNRQVKVFQKLLGTRKSGSKKRWFINDYDYDSMTDQSKRILANPINISQTKNEGKNANRRVAILNKLFMKHITDLMATGIASEQIVGKGIEISRVKVTTDFHVVNVYWICKGTFDDIDIEKCLNRCSGIIRHELSQLRLMGEIPRINFVKDKSYTKLIEVENILKTCDYGDTDYVKYDIGIQTRNELNLEYFEYEENKNKQQEEDTLTKCDENNDDNIDEPLPIMRHDVLGLNHKDIMDKILIKMKKSKLAWDKYEQQEENNQQIISISKFDYKENEKLQQKLAMNKTKEEEFEKFLMRKKYKKNVPERKKSFKYENDVMLNNRAIDHDDENHRKDDGDYIEEIENK